MTIRKLGELTPQIDSRVYVDESAQVIGDVVIGEDSSIWPQAVVRGDIHAIRIGRATNIQDGSILHVTHDSHFVPGGHALTIGNEVTVGHGVILHGCKIGDQCLIGMGSTVLDGAVIESGAMLGAGSLVTSGKVLNGGYLWLGRPAKKIRKLSADEQEYLTYAANHYVNLKNRYKSEHN